MGLRKITKEKLTEWENTYAGHLQGSEETQETKSCFLSLEEVKALMTYIDGKNRENPTANIDNIGIYLTRSNECPVVITVESKGIPQISFAIAPLVGTETFIDNDGSIMCLYPGDYPGDENGITPGGTNSGLCPPCIKKGKGG